MQIKQEGWKRVDMWPDVDWKRVGQRVKAARHAKGLTQAQLGAMVGCSNNHISHVEVGQTKLSLSLLLRLAVVLEKSCDYFLMDTPYLRREALIEEELAEKLDRCMGPTLLAVSRILDLLLELQSFGHEAGDWNGNWRV